MLNDHRLGFVFITADVVILDLPMRWTPKLYAHQQLTRRC